MGLVYILEFVLLWDYTAAHPFDFLIHKDVCQTRTPVQAIACILNPERSLKAVKRA